MPIIIENITDVPTSRGSNKYRIRVNQKVIAEFYHMREEGISECLRRAAEACEDPKRIEIVNDTALLMDLLSYGQSLSKKGFRVDPNEVDFCKHGVPKGVCKLGEKDCNKPGWNSLTKEDIMGLFKVYPSDPGFHMLCDQVKLIDDKLKEKNL